MKSRPIFTVLLAALLLFTGCTHTAVQKPDETAPVETGVSETTADPSAAQTEGLADNNENTLAENMFFNSAFAVMHDDVLYFTEETSAGKVQLTYFYDTKTGLVMPLCGKPECTHDTEGCSAYYPSTFGDLNYAFYNGELYWIGDLSVKDGKKMINVYACGPDGMNRRVAAQLDWEYDALASGFFGIYDGRIYRGGMGSYVSNGNAVTGAAFYSQALKGEPDPKEILRVDEDVNVVLSALAPGKFYFMIYGWDESPKARLYEYDIAADELKTLYEGSVPGWAYRMSALEDRLVFYGGRKIAFSFSLQSMEMKTIELSEEVGTIEIGDRSIYAMNGYTEYLCFDLDGKLLYKGERDPSLFHEEKQLKQYLGCSEGVFYSVFSSDDYHYLVVYDSNTDTWTVPWEAKVAK